MGYKTSQFEPWWDALYDRVADKIVVKGGSNSSGITEDNKGRVAKKKKTKREKKRETPRKRAKQSMDAAAKKTRTKSSEHENKSKD